MTSRPPKAAGGALRERTRVIVCCIALTLASERVGDPSALPMLREILYRDPADRYVYYAINAVTRLTKKDVRPKPVKEMDLEATRRKVLELLPTGK